jgi:hypothetical protein
MCSVTGAMAKGVSVGKCVAPLATFYCGRNIAHNVLQIGGRFNAANVLLCISLIFKK